jgi:hypothetical protein
MQRLGVGEIRVKGLLIVRPRICGSWLRPPALMAICDEVLWGLGPPQFITLLGAAAA